MRPTMLAERSWTELDTATPPIVVVPIGSLEQHGPHLPLATDTIIAESLASTLVATRHGCLLAPPLAITASGEHAGFPGTLSIGTDALATVLIELVRSADWSDGVVLVNAHGGNAEPLRRAEVTLAHERRPVLCWMPRHATPGDLHAGHDETSMLLALRRELVRPDLAVAGPSPSYAELTEHGVRPLSPSGVLGDPSAASASSGERLLALLAADLVASFDDWRSRAGRRG